MSRSIAPVRLVGSSSADDDPVSRLTPREREVLRLVADGRSNHAICSELYVAPKTLERHMQHIYLKLGLDQAEGGVHRRVAAVLAWHFSPSGGAAPLAPRRTRLTAAG